ncbi:hypothetical protein ABPG74_018625 [Tetrahymena malaccensis]
MDIENTTSQMASPMNCHYSQYSEYAKPQNVDYKIVSRTTSRTSSGGSCESFASLSTCLLQELSASIQNGSVNAPEFLAKMFQKPEDTRIPVLSGEIPLGISCFQQWKRVVGYEKKLDGELFEFSLQDMENERISFEEGIHALQNNTKFKFPALQIFISKFQQIHAKRQARRLAAQKQYQKQSVFHEFIADFQQKFVKRTDKAIKGLLSNTPGYIVTLRCRQNVETNQHEVYKMGFSNKFIQLLGVDSEQICYDFMKNGLREFIDEESLLNLSSVLICYHMTKCLQERKIININLKTYDNLVLPTTCSIQFHGEKMDKSNSYFESIISLNIIPDQQFYPLVSMFRQQMALQQQNQLQQQMINQQPNQILQQQQQQQSQIQGQIPSQTSFSSAQNEAFKRFLTPINPESFENNKIILEKFYGYSFENGVNTSKTCKIKYI